MAINLFSETYAELVKEVFARLIVHDLHRSGVRNLVNVGVPESDPLN
jgi:hypothetical protein